MKLITILCDIVECLRNCSDIVRGVSDGGDLQFPRSKLQPLWAAAFILFLGSSSQRYWACEHVIRKRIAEIQEKARRRIDEWRLRLELIRMIKTNVNKHIISMMKFMHSITLAGGKQSQNIYLHVISNRSCIKSTDCSFLCRIWALFLLHFILLFLHSWFLCSNYRIKH